VDTMPLSKKGVTQLRCQARAIAVAIQTAGILATVERSASDQKQDGRNHLRVECRPEVGIAHPRIAVAWI
jgi:hypothetical protein